MSVGHFTVREGLYFCMFSFMQKLMSVPWGSVDVLRYVPIPLEASLVVAMLATSWMLTTRPAHVCVCVCVCMCVCLCVCV